MELTKASRAELAARFASLRYNLKPDWVWSPTVAGRGRPGNNLKGSRVLRGYGRSDDVFVAFYGEDRLPVVVAHKQGVNPIRAARKVRMNDLSHPGEIWCGTYSKLEVTNSPQRDSKPSKGKKNSSPKPKGKGKHFKPKAPRREDWDSVLFA